MPLSAAVPLEAITTPFFAIAAAAAAVGANQEQRAVGRTGQPRVLFRCPQRGAACFALPARLFHQIPENTSKL